MLPTWQTWGLSMVEKSDAKSVGNCAVGFLYSVTFH